MNHYFQKSLQQFYSFFNLLLSLGDLDKALLPLTEAAGGRRRMQEESRIRYPMEQNISAWGDLHPTALFPLTIPPHTHHSAVPKHTWPTGSKYDPI